MQGAEANSKVSFEELSNSDRGVLHSRPVELQKVNSFQGDQF